MHIATYNVLVQVLHAIIMQVKCHAVMPGQRSKCNNTVSAKDFIQTTTTTTGRPWQGCDYMTIGHFYTSLSIPHQFVFGASFLLNVVFVLSSLCVFFIFIFSIFWSSLCMQCKHRWRVRCSTQFIRAFGVCASTACTPLQLHIHL